MGFLDKKPDPISDKQRALNDEIAALEAEIKKLDSQLSRTATPKFRSTAQPHGQTVPRATEKPVPPPPAEPVFEEIKVKPLQPRDDSATPDYYNELGVRKYDLPALWNRVRNHFRGPTTSNPRLVNYLAAGGVQGLKPLRYEKRVARNRVMVLATVFFLIMLGTLLLWLKHR
jgi:cell division protein FtsB